ncbi:MAG: D-alanyl-D-alanine carboxypeptidase [Mogibacterium sp.]|nr:D-alanyl-D-alanine carboxypeptidase [Mogibacterium sp.]
MTEKHAKQTEKKKKIRIDYGKAARALALLILLVTVVFSYLPAALGKGIMNYDRDLIRPSGELGSKAPGIRAETAIMYSLDLDMPVYEKNADKKMPPYSMTKILTGYLALENLDPDEVLTASENATRELKDGMELELEPGEKAKVIDLVYALMMMSANDGAIVLAEGVSGTEKAFVDLMNETVKEWGCENTHFVNTNGWENKDHYTTARDMAIITKNCLENEKLKEISMTKEYVFPATNMSDDLEMDNALLKSTDNFKLITGGKTGTWSETECTVALEFEDSGLSSVIVLMGDTAKGRAKDPRTLAEAAHDLTPGFVVTDSDKGVCKAWVRHGVKPTMSLDVSGLRYAYPKNQKASGVKVKTEVDLLDAPIAKGDKVGKYYIYANKEQVGQGYLYAGEDIEKGWLPSYLFISNKATLLAGSAILLVLLLGWVLNLRRRTMVKRRKSS